MIKVRCIDNLVERGRLPITIGKIYSVVDEIDSFYTIINDNGKEWDYLKYRFEEVKEMDKEKVLEVEFQEVFDKVAWRITYQNEEILDRGFKDYDLKVMAEDAPEYYDDILWLRGYNKRYDNRVNLSTKEEAEIIKQRVDAINEKYGIPKRWRAEYDGKYFVIGNDGVIFGDVDKRYDTDDRRYILGNYFKTKEEAQAKLEKIKQILQGE